MPGAFEIGESVSPVVAEYRRFGEGEIGCAELSEAPFRDAQKLLGHGIAGLQSHRLDEQASRFRKLSGILLFEQGTGERHAQQGRVRLEAYGVAIEPLGFREFPLLEVELSRKFEQIGVLPMFPEQRAEQREGLVGTMGTVERDGARISIGKIGAGPVPQDLFRIAQKTVELRHHAQVLFHELRRDRRVTERRPVHPILEKADAVAGQRVGLEKFVIPGRQGPCAGFQHPQEAQHSPGGKLRPLEIGDRRLIGRLFLLSGEAQQLVACEALSSRGHRGAQLRRSGDRRGSPQERSQDRLDSRPLAGAGDPREMSAGDVPRLVGDHAGELQRIFGATDESGIEKEVLTAGDEGVEGRVGEQVEMHLIRIEPGSTKQRIRQLVEIGFDLGIPDDGAGEHRHAPEQQHAQEGQKPQNHNPSPRLERHHSAATGPAADWPSHAGDDTIRQHKDAATGGKGTEPMKASRRSDIAPFIVMQVLEAANARAAEGAEVLHLELGEPGGGTPPGAVRAAREALGSASLGYSEALGLPELRQRVARFYRERYGVEVPATAIAITVGASGAFVLAFLAAFDAGDRVALVEPGYPAYRNILRALDIEVVRLPAGFEERFQPTPELLERAGPLDGLILASPANPTGTMLSEAEIASLAAWCRTHSVRLIADEIYHGITFDRPASTVLAADPAALVVNSFSKYFCMTGWRLGWLVMPGDLRDRFLRLAQNLFIAPPTIAQHAALGAFDDLELLERRIDLYRNNRDRLLATLQRAGIRRIAPPDGAFYLYVEIEQLGVPATELCRQMLEEIGVAATPGVDFDPVRGERFLRLSFCAAESEIEEACRRLEPWLRARISCAA